MKSFIIYMLTITISVFGSMAVINYVVDPGHVYSTKYIDKVVEGARRRLNVEGVTNLDERLYKQKFAEIYKGRTFDYLALGSSRIMTVSEDALNGASLLNLGVSGCKIEDMIALCQICKNNNIHYKNVLIAVDPTFFNGFDTDSRWKSIKSYFDEFEGNDNSQMQNPDLTLIKNLFSPSYFKSAIVALLTIFKGGGGSELKYVRTFVNDGGAKRTDGSIYYDKKHRETPQEAIDRDAITWKHGSYNNFNTISQERIDLFEKFIKYLNKEETNVIFFRCPFHPVYYKRVLDMRGAVEAFNYVENYAKKNGIRLIGSFNPDDVGFKNIDFYDAVHARKESVDKLFPNGDGAQL